MTPRKGKGKAPADWVDSDDSYHDGLSSGESSAMSGSDSGGGRRRSGRLSGTKPVDYAALAGGEPEKKKKPKKARILGRKSALDLKKPRKGRRYRKVKGEVRYAGDGTMEFRDGKYPNWTPAAYHNDHRRQFIDEDAPTDGFDWAPRCGYGTDDETSHVPMQRPWSEEHLDRIVDAEGRKIMYDLNLPQGPRPKNLGDWFHNGKVLLDQDNCPVKSWPGLNKTLSSEIEDWHFEALRRLYPHLKTRDLKARMPHVRRSKTGSPLKLQSNAAFTNRAMRFRLPRRIIPLKKRKGTQVIADYLLESMKKANAISAEGLPDLTKDEVLKARKKNRGQFRNNSCYIYEEDKEKERRFKSGNAKRKLEDTDYDSDVNGPASSGKRPRIQPKIEPRSDSTHLSSLSPYRSSWDETGPSQTIKQSLEDDDNIAYGPPSPPPSSSDSEHSREGTHIASDSHTLVNDSDYDADSNSSSIDDHGENNDHLVPLFVSTSDEELAAIQDLSYTTPQIVLRAKAEGCTMLGDVDVAWYPDNTAREVDENGVLHENVVHRLLSDTGVDVDTRIWTSNYGSPAGQDGYGNPAIDQDDDSMDNEEHEYPPPPYSSMLSETRAENLSHPMAAFPEQTALDDEENDPPKYEQFYDEPDYYEEPWRTHFGPSGF